MAGTLMSKFNTATEGFSTLQKVGSVAMVAAIAAGVFFYANTTSQSPMAPLYTELTTADAASITEQLRDLASITTSLIVVPPCGCQKTTSMKPACLLNVPV